MERTDLINTVKNGQLKANLTVEASFLVPLALFIIVGSIQLGYDLFQQARISSEIQEELEKLEPVEIVRKNTLINDLKKNGEEN